MKDRTGAEQNETPSRESDAKRIAAYFEEACQTRAIYRPNRLSTATREASRHKSAWAILPYRSKRPGESPSMQGPCGDLLEMIYGGQGCRRRCNPPTRISSPKTTMKNAIARKPGARRWRCRRGHRLKERITITLI